MNVLNTWLRLQDALKHHDSTAYPAEILQAIPLTLALQALHADFEVRLLHLGNSPIYVDEQSHVGDSKGFSREVYLCLNQQPVVWARSVCQQHDAVWQEIMNCGTMPLGMRLYELPLERSEFEYAQLSAEHPANPVAEPIVARRSRFMLQDASLLLIESYLPALQKYL